MAEKSEHFEWLVYNTIILWVQTQIKSDYVVLVEFVNLQIKIINRVWTTAGIPIKKFASGYIN